MTERIHRMKDGMLREDSTHITFLVIRDTMSRPSRFGDVCFV